MMTNDNVDVGNKTEKNKTKRNETNPSQWAMENVNL